MHSSYARAARGHAVACSLVKPHAVGGLPKYLESVLHILRRHAHPRVHIRAQRQKMFIFVSLARALADDNLVNSAHRFVFVAVWLERTGRDGLHHLVCHRVLVIIRHCYCWCWCCLVQVGIEGSEDNTESANVKRGDLFAQHSRGGYENKERQCSAGAARSYALGYSLLTVKASLGARIHGHALGPHERCTAAEVHDDPVAPLSHVR